MIQKLNMIKKCLCFVLFCCIWCIILVVFYFSQFPVHGWQILDAELAIKNYSGQASRQDWRGAKKNLVPLQVKHSLGEGPLQVAQVESQF